MRIFRFDSTRTHARFSQANIAILLFLAVISGTGCAKIADPQPPEVLIPKPAVDLAVRQLSDYLVLTVSKPGTNTNGSEVTTFKRVDVYRLRQDENRLDLTEEQFIKSSNRILSVESPHFAGYLNEKIFVFQDKFLNDKPAMYSHTYRYAVLFVNKKNQSAGLSNQTSITPVPIPPPPGEVTAEVTQNSIRLKWTVPSENMDGSKPPRTAGYNIYRTEEPKKLPSIPLNSNPAKTPEFEDSNFRFDTTYYYAITTVGSLQQPCPESLPSSLLPITPKDTFPPDPPSDFSAIVQGNMVILLWSPSPSADADGYRLYRREKGMADRRLLQPNLVRGLSFRDSQVEPGKQYEYMIQAIDAYGNASQPVKTDSEQR